MVDTPFEIKNAKINKRYKPSDKENDIREWVYKRKKDMEEAPHRQQAEKKAESGEKAWEAYRQEKNENDWQSDYYIPLTTSVIESTLSEMVEQKIRPMVLPRGVEDAAAARVMNRVFEYSWDCSNGDLMLQDVLRSTLIRGTGFAQEYYLRDKRMVEDIINIEKKGKRKYHYKTQKREVYEYDDVMAEEVSFWDMFVDEKAREFNTGPYKARDAIRRYIMSYHDAERFFDGPIWNPNGNFRFVKPGGDTEYYQFYKPPQGINHQDEVEVLWYWGRLPEDMLTIVVNDVVVRMGPNPYLHKQIPFAKSVDVKRVDKFYGKGEAELLESIQEELNTIRRMTIDRHHLDIDKTFIMDPTVTSISDEDLIARPHGAIPGDPAKVKPLEYGDIPASVQLTQRAINEDAVRVTGIDDRFQALQKTPSTATEAAILKESTLKRIRMKIINLEKGFLTDIGRMRLANIMQFYSQPKYEKIIGEKDSEQYKREMAMAAASDRLKMIDGEPRIEKFKQIRTENLKLYLDEKGGIKEERTPGTHFFEIHPKYFMPVSSGGYDFKIESGPALPVSKPLMQDKLREMAELILPLADGETTSYDPEKIVDELIRAYDYNPQEWKRQDEDSEEAVSSNRIELAVDLAAQENDELSKGGDIPENGTPYAPPAHTQVHIAFLRSDKMKQAPEDLYQKLVRHIMGEIMAITTRLGQGGTELLGGQTGLQVGAPPSGGPQTETVNGGDRDLGATMPGRIQGGGQVPTGRALGNG